MSAKRLWVNEAPDPITVNDFVWRRAADGQSSLQVGVGPNLEEFGTVLSSNRDAVWLSTVAFLADRTTSRGKGWQRELQLVVPTTNPELWNSVSADIDAMLAFLTSDVWKTAFALSATESAEHHSHAEPAQQLGSDVVCLFSGGADSVCGAVRAITEGRHVTLVSHWDWSGHSAVQSQLVGELQSQFDVEIPHIRVNLGRKANQIGGASFQDEPSRRSRSLLFVTLGLAVASASGLIPLWIAENGFTSLNPPLASERRGALSTRTTHPEFLSRLRSILQTVGAHTDFTNLYGDMTKGEMFGSVTDVIGQEDASALLSKTHSCSHVRWAMEYHRPSGTQCGVCFGCLVRRAAFMAAGLEDRTTYLVTHLGARERDRFLTSMGRAQVEAMRYAVNREFGPADVLALNLPDGYDLESALNLVHRGFRELAAVDLP